jgi:DNA-binding beta-propeller fold protein YncE
MPDIFDYVVVFYSADWRDRADPISGLPINVQPVEAGATHEWTRNFTRGIGFELSPGQRFGNRAGTNDPPLTTRRLQSRIDMNDLAEYDENFMFQGLAGVRAGVSRFAHELGHRFAAFADVVPDPFVSLRVRGERPAAHWSPLFNSFGSVVASFGLTGNLISEHPPGTFHIDAQEITYGPWDEYLMGLVPPAGVPSSFIVQNPVPNLPFFLVNDVFTGERINVTIDDVILNEGPRLPNSNLSQRVFHVGVCLVIPKNDSVCVTEVQRAHAFADTVANFWKTETEGRAMLNTRMCPTVYTQPETSIPVSGFPVDAAILPNGKKLYVAEKALEVHSVAVIDTDPTSSTFHTVKKNILLPEGSASGIDVSADGSRIFVTTPVAPGPPCSGVGSAVKIIDTTTDTVVGTLCPGSVGGASGAQAIAVARAGVIPGLNRAYVLLTQPPRIAVYNMNNNPPTPMGEFPVGAPDPVSSVIPDIEVTPDGSAIVFTRPGRGMVSAQDRIFGVQWNLDMGGLVPTGVAIVQLESNADNTPYHAMPTTTWTSPPALVYVTTQSGVTRVFDLMTDPVWGILRFQPMADPPDGVSPLRPDIAGTGAPGALEVEFSPGGNLAVVGNTQNDTVSLVNTSTHAELPTMITLDPPIPPSPLGAEPAAFVFSPDGQRLYVMSKQAQRVDVFR